jgi:hypothetical protein
MQRNRVLAIGENHEEGNSLIAEYAPEFMRELKKSGATHLAIERVPGANIPERDPAYTAMLNEARRQGLKIVEVDYGGPIPPGVVRGDYRNAWMANKVGEILDEDSDNKVVALSNFF